MIKNIIFDLGNVLLDQKTVSADIYFASVLNVSEKDSKTFYKIYYKDAVKGILSFENLVGLYKENFTSNLSVDEIIYLYTQHYIDDVRQVNTVLIDLIEKLRIAYKTYMMTNTLEPHFNHWKTLGFDQFFDGIFRSDTDHFIKPEKESYLYVVNKIGAKVEECLFIDDLEVNVRGAKEAGLHGIIYQNNSLLKSDLHNFGVIV